MDDKLALATTTPPAVEMALIQGDLSRLTMDQRLAYYKAVCESVGLNPLTKPFDYITLSGKLTLYAKRDATDQLRKIHGVSVVKLDKERIEDVWVVTAYVKDKNGREDSSIGAVTIGNLKGDSLANALMKAETKAKRRATLSICGLGVLDETEIGTIPNAVPASVEELRESAKDFEKHTEVSPNVAKLLAEEPERTIDASVSQERNDIERVTVIVAKTQRYRPSAPFIVVSGMYASGDEFEAAYFHKSSQDDLRAATGECEFGVRKNSPNQKFAWVIEKIIRIGSVHYTDNVRTEAPSGV